MGWASQPGAERETVQLARLRRCCSLPHCAGESVMASSKERETQCCALEEMEEIIMQKKTF